MATVIVSVSGGLGSAEALRRCIETYGKDRIVALFADVKGVGTTHFHSFPAIDSLLHERYGGETADTYRFIWELSHHFDIPIERIGSDKTIWTVFAEKRAMRLFVGNNLFCPASKHLKREAVANWITENIDGPIVMALGFAWDEEHRLKAAQHHWENRLARPVEVIAPNAVAPYADNVTIAAWLHRAGIAIPSAYEAGFEHNNCAGGCVHGGQGHFAKLYHERFETYMYWLYQERQMQKYLGKDVTILKDSRGGETKPLSLSEFINRIQIGDYRKSEGQSCACFASSDWAEFIAQAELKTEAK